MNVQSDMYYEWDNIKELLRTAWDLPGLVHTYTHLDLDSAAIDQLSNRIPLEQSWRKDIDRQNAVINSTLQVGGIFYQV